MKAIIFSILAIGIVFSGVFLWAIQENDDITWIPATTPPDDGETVIIHTLGGEVWTGFLDGKVWRNVSGARIHDEEPVLHWQPLPLPPEDAE